MRRSLGLLCVAAAACLGPLAEATGANPAQAHAAPVPSGEPGAVADESAIASWMFPTGRPRHSRWIFAGAYRNATAGGRTVTTGFAVKGHCKVVRERGETVTRCHGRGFGGPLQASAFEVDPALRSARLVLNEDDQRHELEWRADAPAAPPSGYVAGETCDEGTGQGAGFLRHATASGHVLDHRVGRVAIDHAFLSRGAMLTECTGEAVRSLARRAAAGERVGITFR